MNSFELSNSNFKKKNSHKPKLWGVFLVVLCSFVFLVLLTNFFPNCQNFILGLFGLFAYPLSIIAFCVGIALINNKKYIMPKKYILFLAVAILCVLILVNIIILGNPNCTFGEYLALTYNFKYTAGGLIAGIFLAPLIKTIGIVGSVIIYLVVLVVFSALIADFLHSIKTYGFKKVNKPEKVVVNQNIITTPDIQQEPQVVAETKEDFNLFLDEKLQEQTNNNALIKLGLMEGNLDSEKSPKEKKSIKEILLTPTEIDLTRYRTPMPTAEKRAKEINNNIQQLKQDEPVVGNKNSNNNEQPKPIYENNQKLNNYFTNQKPEQNIEQPKVVNSEQQEYVKPKKFVQLQMEGTEKPSYVNTYRRPPNYNMPPLELLENVEVDLTSLNEDVVGKRERLESTLETFGISAKVIGVVVGPSVTRYELEMPQGVSVKKLLNLEDDISMTMASKAGIRIEAPIPGKSAVGIEVPNDNIATVSLKEIIDSNEFQNSRKSLTFALGKDIAGSIQLCSLTNMPHLLVAGATNSGKSICLNSIILSLVYKYSPEDLRFILVDPKRVEFSLYNDLPHMLIPNAITDVNKAINAFNWVIHEMERRYELFQMARCKKFEEYNNMPEVLNGEAPKIPYLVIIVDELADLMTTNKKDLEEKIKRLAQMGRAAGIHLILATQRPSVDVITGTIKVNFPSRISFALTSSADSKTILDQGGAENLLGRGDMLYSPTDMAIGHPRRIQGCFVSNAEVENVVEYIKQNNKSDFNEETEKEIDKDPTSVNFAGQYESNIGDVNFDPYLPRVLKMCIENGMASISAIQRRFLVGFPRAGRILEQLQKLGYVSEPDGTKPRNMLISMEQFIEKYGTNVE